MNYVQRFEQLRRAMQMFAAGLDEEKALEIATVYDEWKPGKAYAAGDYFTYGENSVGDPQLYKVNQAHTSAAEWLPGTAGAEALYTAIGLNEQGFPVWARPSGAHDAYNAGDIVDYNGKLYTSLIDGNVYAPDEYPAGWAEYTGASNV